MFGSVGKVGLSSAGGGGGGGVKGVTLDFNFLTTTLDSRLTFNRPSTATDGLYTDAAASSFNSFAAGVPRISAANGLLVESATTNFLLNSGAPATQTTGSLSTGNYCLWVIGTGSAALTAGTATITGAGTATAGNPVLFNVTVAGTVTVTVSGSLTRFQLENSINPTSYVPTVGATVTRNIEVVSLVVSSWYNSVASSMAAECLVPFVNTINNIVSAEINDGTLNNRISLSQTPAKHSTAVITNSGTATSATSTNTLANNTIFKCAGAYGAAGETAALSGTVTARVAGPAGGIPGSLTTLRLGTLAGGTNVLDGFIRRFRYWPRELSPSELAAVTT